MYRTWIAILAILNVACGQDTSKLIRVRADCLGEVYTDHAVNADAVTFNVTLARNLMTERGYFSEAAFAGKPTFCDYYSNLLITIQNVEVFDCSDGSNRVDDQACHIGYYSLGTGVRLNQNMDILPHELFHALDTGNLQPGTYWHEGWDTNGYNDVILAYQQQRHTL